MTIGIPQALLYHRYSALWETFFKTLGHEVVLSGPSDREKMRRGTALAIDEACLSSKLYLGHVDALVGSCDMVFVPRIGSLGQHDRLCTRFEALTDIVSNTFRDTGIRVLDCNVDVRHSSSEMAAFTDLGKQLGHRRTQIYYAYMLAKQAEQLAHQDALLRQDLLLEREGIKVLVVGHSYNLFDALIGQPVLELLSRLEVTPIVADTVKRDLALRRSAELTQTLPWVFNREQVGAVQCYRDRVQGIVLLSAFPCGPDALVNEMLLRRVKGLPMLNLLVDNQEGSAGIETRVESFVDIIRFRREGAYV